MTSLSLSVTDNTVVITFVVFSVSLPFLIGYWKRRAGFFSLTFAGRALGFWAMALTMFLSENGTAQFQGLAGWAVHSGFGIYAYELVGGFGLLTLGWIFMPVYMASGVFTTIDYANKRFGGKRIGIVMVILMMTINMLSKFSAELHTTHTMLQELYAVSTTAVNALLLLMAVIVVYPGGLYSLVYTNNMQFIFFVVGMPVIFVFSYIKFMSWQEIRLRYQKSWPNTTILHVSTNSDYKYTRCGIPDINALDLIRSHNDPDLPWPGMVFGIYIISIYNFCIDQSIMQFCLGAKNIVNAKYACILHAFFKVSTIFMVIPGFIARVLYTDTVACADPDICERICGKRSGCSDLALPQLFARLVPKGWRGIVLVSFMAATLTSLAATLHAGSTIFVINLYHPLRPRATECECTLVGKLVVLVQAGLGMALVPVVNKIPHMHEFMREIYATLVPPLVAVYVAAIFWDRVTEKNAFRTLVLGTCIAVVRIIWKLTYGFVPCGDENQVNVPDIITNFHDLHFAIFLFVICSCYIVITGLMTDPISHIHLYRLVYWLRHDTRKRIGIEYFKQPFVKNSAKTDNTTTISRRPYMAKDFEESSIDDRESPKISPHPKRVEWKGVESTNSSDDSQDSQESDISEEMEEEEEGMAKDKRCCFLKWKALSTRRLSYNAMEKAMSAQGHVRELPSEAQTANILLIVLLLVIVFVMGFFS